MILGNGRLQLSMAEAASGKKDIRRLQIAMQNAATVRMGDGVGQRVQQTGGFVWRQRSAVDRSRQRIAGNVLKNDDRRLCRR